MQATARAQPNIALVKYWGKRDSDRNLPAVDSLSLTLADLHTDMQVRFEDGLAHDELTLNAKPRPDLGARVSRCLDRVAGPGRSRARIDSHSNFPVGAGLASSASSFAALVVAGAAAAGRKASREELARLAGAESGSAARSLYGGIVELVNRDDTIDVGMLCSVDDWDLRVVVAVTDAGPKPVASGDAMELSRRTSPFYGRWIDEQPADMAAARAALTARDLDALGEVAEHNCLKMHSVMWASRPAMVYWNAATVNCLQTVRDLRRGGHGVFFTIDAGPQVKAICTPDHEDAVAAALAETAGVREVLRSRLGEGARLLGEAA
mgnify:CR=1 FL=1